MTIFYLLTSCSLLTDNTVTATVEDQYSGDPLEGVEVSFHSVSGSYGGSRETDKYQATSGVGGKLSFEVEEIDLDNKFSPNVEEGRFNKPYDSTDAIWNYLLTREGIYRNPEKNQIVKMKPAGSTIFVHPHRKDNSYEIDTIIVSGYFQVDTLTQLNHTCGLYFRTNQMQEYTIKYILPDGTERSIASEIFVPTVLKPDEIIENQVNRENIIIEIPK